MIRLKNTIGVLLLLAVFGCGNGASTRKNNTTEPVKQESTQTPDLLIDLKKVLSGASGAKNIAIDYDQYFLKKKKFLAFDLAALIDSFAFKNNFDTTGAVVVFECTDGYRPTLDIGKVFGSKKGYIAIRDLDAPEGKSWLDSLAQKFEPYYLVWADLPKDDHNYAWPYGLLSLRLVPASAEFKTIYPFSEPQLATAFELFRNNCMKCHAVNKVGGVMGPEFNIPKNITEYWREEDILAFAKNPTSYRISSHMPPMGNLTDMEIKQIIQYLKYMSNHKI